MGKINLRKEKQKGRVSLPPVQPLKPLTEMVTVADSPVSTSKSTLKKYVSPLSLAWKRTTPIEETKKVPSPSETGHSKKSPETVTSDCQDIAAVSTSLPTQVTPTAADKRNKSQRPCDLDEHENLESSFKISEGEFNISRVCVASTPLPLSGAGETKQVEGFDSVPVANSKASASPKKRKKKGSTNCANNGDASTADACDDNNSCIKTAPDVKEKEDISPRFKKLRKSPCEIETIDLDMTNDATTTDIELISIKKLPKKPVEIVDLSATLDDPVPKGNNTIIVIDDDQPFAPNSRRALATTISNTRKSERKSKSKKQSNRSRLIKIQPHPGLIKKKERQRNKKKIKANMLPTLAKDDVCFLGTGISFRPPISTASNAAIQPARSVPSSSAGSSTENHQTGAPSQPSIYGNNFDNPNSNQPQSGLRPIVIDGSNVAMAHGKKDKVFSSKGIEICINYFLKRGHKVYCFIPLFRKSDPFTKDRHILEALEEQGHLICTPSRYVGSNAIVPYDDRYIVQIAAELGGVIISRDNFRDLIAENPIFREVIVERTLMYTWVGDIIMFPNDPFGRRNVSLDRMLSF